MVLWTDHITACCVGVLGLDSGSRVQVDYIWCLLFVGPSSSALFLPLWVHFQHETLPLVSGLTRGRPCLYLSTTRSLSRPVHTCSSGSLHHFQLVQLLLRSSPLQENMIIELLALSHISCGTCSDKWVGHFLELKQPQEIVRVRLVHSNRNMWEHSDEGRSQNTYLHDHHGYFKLC